MIIQMQRSEEKSQMILDGLRQFEKPRLSFTQKISRTLEHGEIPLVKIECFVIYEDLEIMEKYLTILTPPMDFKSDDWGEGFTLSPKARALIQQGAGFILKQLEGKSLGLHPSFYHHHSHMDYEPLELQVRWLEHTSRLKLEEKLMKGVRYLERRYELRFNQMEQLSQLQWELQNEGHDLMIFRDLFIPYAEMVEEVGSHQHRKQLQDFINDLPRVLKRMPSSARGLCLDLIYLAIAYLEECVKSGKGEVKKEHLEILHQLVFRDHDLNVEHYEELSYSIYLDSELPPCVENLELVLAKKINFRSKEF